MRTFHRLSATVKVLEILLFLLLRCPTVPAVSRHIHGVKVAFLPAPSRPSCNTWRHCLEGRRRTENTDWFRTRIDCHDATTAPHEVLNQKQVDGLSDLVQRRAVARFSGDYAQADALRDEIDATQVPEGFQIVLQDVPRSQGGGSVWKLVRRTTLVPAEGSTVLQLAHAALGLAMASSENRIPVPSDKLQSLVQQAKDRLKYDSVVEELRGRKAADAAFWFSSAGVSDEALLKSLTKICTRELERFGSRSSCRAKDVWHILERLAAAGVRDDAELVRVAAACLDVKTSSDGEHMIATPECLLDLHSDRCLLMIWKFSTRQRKQRAFLQSALQHWERIQSSTETVPAKVEADSWEDFNWSGIFTDPTLPLVVDIGCGMGVSLLGIASLDEDSPLVENNWSNCNLAGVDLSGLAVGYARGMAHRRGHSGRLNFFVDSADNLMRRVETYPGPVKLCMIQFPTPFRLPKVDEANGQGNRTSSGFDDHRGNSQLPTTANNGFMVTEALLHQVHNTIRGNDSSACGKLLLQSNCEDVAVWMRRIACEHAGFCPTSVRFDDAVTESEAVTTRIPKRTLDWISMDGERAEGIGWSSRPLLPRRGATETEVACIVNGTPVHRCLLLPQSDHLRTKRKNVQ